MTKLGMVRVAAVSPALKIANPIDNSREIIHFIKKAHSLKAGLVVFPALCLTGVSCGDLFYQDSLYDYQLKGLKDVVSSTKGISCAVVMGIYLRMANSLVECGILIQNQKIKGLVPSYCSPRQNRWFSRGPMLTDKVKIFGESIDCGKIIFTDRVNGISMAIEVADDILTPLSPGDELALAGAQIIANPTSSKEVIGSSPNRLNAIAQKGITRLCSHVYSSAGALESSSTGIYSGHCIISEKGKILETDSHPSLKSKFLINDIDYQVLKYERAKSNTFKFSNLHRQAPPVINVDLDELPVLRGNIPLIRTYSKRPFVPENYQNNCHEAFTIQTTALARRLIHTKSKKIVLGISGGLDSTLALLATAGAMRLLEKPMKDLIAVTMPGFGTSKKTYSSGMAMMEALGCDIRIIPIKEAVLLHFKDIGHNPKDRNTVYENVQARERTQVLMNIANMEEGIQIGTGDLSEIALGWSTYNGDHMSMYNVNAGFPKTFLRAMISWFIDCMLSNPAKPFSLDDSRLATALQEVLDTPVSPELLPTDGKDEILQKTEDKIGPYILHDFFLYHTIHQGLPPLKLLTIAKTTFSDEFEEAFIKKWLRVFYIRFFAHQFKRTCAPDSPQIGSVSLSPRYDWTMPSDGDVEAWLKDLDEEI